MPHPVLHWWYKTILFDGFYFLRYLIFLLFMTRHPEHISARYHWRNMDTTLSIAAHGSYSCFDANKVNVKWPNNWTWCHHRSSEHSRASERMVLSLRIRRLYCSASAEATRDSKCCISRWIVRRWLADNNLISDKATIGSKLNPSHRQVRLHSTRETETGPLSNGWLCPSLISAGFVCLATTAGKGSLEGLENNFRNDT